MFSRTSAMRAFCLTLVLSALILGAGAFMPSGPQARAASFSTLSADFEALLADRDRAGRRDSWLALENRFEELAQKSRGENAARAWFYHARSRQELGRRSFNGADHREAAARFARLAATHPKSGFAAEALFQQGGILYRLGDKEAALPVLERLVSGHPSSPFAAEARTMLAEAGAAAPPDRKNPSAGAGTITLQAITLARQGQRALITLELDNAADVAHNFLPPDPARKTPGRLYLDIANALPHTSLKPGRPPKGLVVTGIRAGRTGSGTRVTLECDGIQCYVVRSPKGSPQIIQIEVSRKEDIKDGISVAGAPSGPTSGPHSGPTSDKSGSRKARGGDSSTVIEQLGLTVQTIMLDAGHGGHDPGAQGADITEKQFTLAMARRIGTLLKKEGFTVLYSRNNDSFISLQDRPDLANEKNADLFISIHVNANPNHTVRGLETYYLSEAKSRDAATVAARENGVSVKNISDLQFILTDLMLSTKLKESRHLANCVHKGILQGLKKASLPASDNGVRSAPFYVLMGARMPAILVEFGYISNERDAANLKNEAFLQRQAEGVVRGIVQYRAELASQVRGAGK